MITKNPASQSIVIRPTGDLDGLGAEHLRQTLRPLLDEGYRYLIFDFERTEFITSSGLGLLVELYNTVVRQEGSLSVINASGRVLWILRQSKLDRVLVQTDPLSSPPQASGEDEIVFDALHSLMSQELLFFSRLNEVAERALKSGDSIEIARWILEGSLAACGAERGALFLHAVDRAELDLALAVGIDACDRGDFRRIPFPPSGAEHRLFNRDRIHLLTETPPGGGDFSRVLREGFGFDRCAIVPVAGAKANRGLLAIEDTTDPEDSAIERYGPLLRAYAAICGLALEKSELLDALQERNRQLSASLATIQQFQDTLVDVGKLASLGAVISGLGHLLNNKLVPIIGYTQLLSQSGDFSDKALKQLNVVGAAAVELKDVMEKLIKVSKVREVERRPVDLNAVLSKTLTLLDHHVERHQVRVSTAFEPELPSILGDHDLLLQAFLAILHRACASFSEARRDRRLEIRTFNGGESVEVVIEDNGDGLSEMTNEDWLDPLVPYTELVQGRLFNYSIPRSVIKRHRGSMALIERDGGGTVVKVSLPIDRSQLPTDAAALRPETEAEAESGAAAA
jgi:anti-anti-sigma factor